MVRFSLGRDFEDGDDGSGPSSSGRLNPKRRKSCAAANASSLTPSPREPPIHIRLGVTDETEQEISEEESDYEGEGEPVDSGCEEEEDGEDADGGDDELEDQLDGENGETVGDGSISVILTDPDVLDCPICLEPLAIPVFQVEFHFLIFFKVSLSPYCKIFLKANKLFCIFFFHKTIEGC